MSVAKKKEKNGMVSTLLKSVREYKKPSMITPIFMAIEAFCECLIPFFAGLLITTIEGGSLSPEKLMGQIGKYGGVLIGLAIFSLLSGIFAGRFAATASCGFANRHRFRPSVHKHCPTSNKARRHPASHSDEPHR